MDRGLRRRARVRRRPGARCRVEVVADGEVGRFPQEVEAAVYFCCLEALQNAGKHAGDVGRDGDDRPWRGAERPGLLVFEVADDGAGFDPAGSAGRGHGFVNMSDRLGAIGGTVRGRLRPGARDPGVRHRARRPAGL